MRQQNISLMVRTGTYGLVPCSLYLVVDFGSIFSCLVYTIDIIPFYISFWGLIHVFAPPLRVSSVLDYFWNFDFHFGLITKIKVYYMSVMQTDTFLSALINFR